MYQRRALPAVNPKTNLHLGVSADGGVLFDLKHDHLLKLNHVGVLMWRLLNEGLSNDQVADRVAALCNADLDRVQTDLAALIENACRENVDPRSALTITEHMPISATEPPHESPFNPNSKRSRVLVVLGTLLLGICDLLLRWGSLQTLCKFVRVCPRMRKANLDHSEVEDIRLAVNRACVWYPRKAVCLLRAAVTTCIFRLRGASANFIIGGRPMPLTQHAWVQIEESVVYDWPPDSDTHCSLAAY